MQKNKKLQQLIPNFGTKFVQQEATKELGLFAYTMASGISFNCFKNPHFLKYSEILNKNYSVPTPYMFANSMLDAADDEVNTWKAAVLESELICLTGDGFTNTKLVNLMNLEALQ